MSVNVNGASLNGTQYVPTGSILAYVGTTAPKGWAFCNGDYLTTANYPELYAVIGTTYGTTAGTFRLPDFKGKFPRGAAVVTTLAGTGGANTHHHTAGASTADAVAAHSHTTNVPDQNSDYAGDHSHTDTTGAASSTFSFKFAPGNLNTGNIAGSHTHSVSTTSNGSHRHSVPIPSTTSSDSGGHSHTTNAVATDSISNIPPYQDINYIIKL